MDSIRKKWYSFWSFVKSRHGKGQDMNHLSRWGMALVVCAICVFGFGSRFAAGAEPGNLALVKGVPAPVIWDDFSDGKISSRTGKDPWGRPLPEWKVTQGKAPSGRPLSDSKLEVVDGSVKVTAAAPTLELPCKVTVGTWKWRYRYPNDAPAGRDRGWNVRFITQSNGSSATLFIADGHWWLDYSAVAEVGGRWPRVLLSHYIINMAGSQIGGLGLVDGKDWHEVVVARDANGYFYSWLDGKFVRWSLDAAPDIKDNVCIVLSVGDAHWNEVSKPVLLDNFEVYDGVVLPPRESIVYDPGAGTIVLDGFGITLAKIAKAVNNPSVFAYDAAKRTAVCSADLHLQPGAQLVIDKATLKLDGTAAAPRKIKFGSDVTFRLNKATLTTTGDAPFVWEGVGEDVTNFNGVLWVKDSTVSNFGGLGMRGIDTVHLENSKFTNLVGEEPMRFIFTVPTHDLTVRGCLFEGQTGAETILFRGGDQFGELVPKPVGIDFVDCEFRNTTFLRDFVPPYYLSPGRPGGTANAINCKFDKLAFNGTTLRMKYYLDVLVVDASGKGVPNAKVIVVNEQDDKNHPAENLCVGQKYMKVGDQVSVEGEKYFSGQTGNWFKGWADVNDHREATTGEDGHTQLPSDAAGTLVITDRVHMAGNPTYTYTVRVETSDGRKGEVKGVKPGPEWRRAKPDEYANTVRIAVK